MEKADKNNGTIERAKNRRNKFIAAKNYRDLPQKAEGNTEHDRRFIQY